MSVCSILMICALTMLHKNIFLNLFNCFCSTLSRGMLLLVFLVVFLFSLLPLMELDTQHLNPIILAHFILFCGVFHIMFYWGYDFDFGFRVQKFIIKIIKKLWKVCNVIVSHSEVINMFKRWYRMSKNTHFRHDR